MLAIAVYISIYTPVYIYIGVYPPYVTADEISMLISTLYINATYYAISGGPATQ